MMNNNEKGCSNFQNKHLSEKNVNHINSDSNNKLSRDEIFNYYNEIYSKDENGKYKKLKFQDYKGEMNYIGKSDSELDVDEIVRLKQSGYQFYELFNNISVNDIKSIKFASKILKIPFTEIVFYTSKLDNGLLYISIPIRGGSSIIIDSRTNEYLFAGSIIDFDTHLKKFLNGERTSKFN